MTATPILSRAMEQPRFSMLAAMMEAQKRHRKPVFAQAAEILRLRHGFGRLQPEEYFHYRLFDDASHDADAKRRYLGVQAEIVVDRICNPDDHWCFLVQDKIVFAAMMQGMGLPVPRLIAFRHPSRPSLLGRDLPDSGALAAFLRASQEPFFGKPADARWSLGAVSVDGYEAASDSLVAIDGRRFPVDAFVAEVEDFAAAGYLIQERLVPHAELRRAAGPAMGTVRMLTALQDGTPTLLRALWKIVAAGNVADNFWRQGNMLGAVDTATGEVLRVISGLGHQLAFHPSHPDTGEPLVGRVLPDWEAARTLCLEAAAALPGLHLVGWDVALTERGPVIVEANTHPAFNLHQHAEGEGILDDRLERLIAACRAARGSRRHGAVSSWRH